MSLGLALEKVRDTAFLLDAIRAADELTAAARHATGPAAVQLLTEAISDDDQLLSIAAVQALGVLSDDAAAAAVSDLLSDTRPYLREHAAWALGSRTPWPDAIGLLVSGVSAGGFPTVIHQRALRRWARTVAGRRRAGARRCAADRGRSGRPGPAGGHVEPGARRRRRPDPAAGWPVTRASRSCPARQRSQPSAAVGAAGATASATRSATWSAG